MLRSVIADGVGTVYYLLFSSLNPERPEAKPGRPEFRYIGTCTSFYIDVPSHHGLFCRNFLDCCGRLGKETNLKGKKQSGV